MLGRSRRPPRLALFFVKQQYMWTGREEEVLRGRLRRVPGHLHLFEGCTLIFNALQC